MTSTAVYRVFAWGLLLYLTWLLVIPEPYESNRVLGSIEKFRVNGYLLHLAAYLGVTVPILALDVTRSVTLASPLLGLLVFHAGLTEGIQHFVPRRTPDWGDWAANLTGISLGLLTMLVIRHCVANRGRSLTDP